MSQSSARGLKILKAIQTYVNTKPNQFDTAVLMSKVQLLSASEGRLRGVFTVEPVMCNSMGTLHGGYITALVDSLAMFGAMTNENGKIPWTTGLHVHFMKSALQGEKVAVETVPIKAGSQPIMETILRREDTGDILAKGTVSLQNGGEKFQKMATEIFQFNFME